jgi:hypothetical protein
LFYVVWLYVVCSTKNYHQVMAVLMLFGPT